MSPASLADVRGVVDPFSGEISRLSPSTLTLALVCSARASASSSSLQSGMPTVSMLRWRSSETVRLQRKGHTALSTSTVISVLLIKRGALRDLLCLLEQFHRALRRLIAEEPPHRGRARDHVGLVAATGDDAMRAHLRPHVLAILRHADVHQHDAIERVTTVPGSDAGMRGLAVEGEGRRDQRRLQEPVGRAELAADMIVEGEVDVVEPAVAHEIGPADELLLGWPAEHLQRALEPEFLASPAWPRAQYRSARPH